MNSYRNPSAQWLGSPNFSLNRDGHNLNADPRWIVMHTMVGTWQSANGRFQQSAQQASAHYGVCLDGSLKQWVDEKDASWAAGNYTVNLDGINIEHEDAGDYNGPRTPALYVASAHLVADICRRYGIPCDRAHIRLHKEVSDAPTGCPDSLDVEGIVHAAQGLLSSTTATAGSEIIAGGTMTRGQKVNAVENWYAIYLHLNYGDPDWPGGADKAGPDITQWANQIQDDGENLDAIRGAFIAAVKTGAPARYAWFDAAKHPAVKGDKGDQGDKGDTGPAGIATPHKHTVTGTADINT